MYMESWGRGYLVDKQFEEMLGIYTLSCSIVATLLRELVT